MHHQKVRIIKKKRSIFCVKIWHCEIEGYRSYIYKDSNGKVTIGIGTYIHEFKEIENKKLRLYLCNHGSNRDSNKNCLESEHLEFADTNTIKKVHDKVKKTTEKTANGYFSLNEVEIEYKDSVGQTLREMKTIYFSPSDAKKAAADHIETKCFKMRIEESFENYNSYPLPALVGLVDLIYNIGEGWGGFIQKFPTCTAAIKNKDWKKAAQKAIGKNLKVLVDSGRETY